MAVVFLATTLEKLVEIVAPSGTPGAIVRKVAAEVARPRGSRSLATHLKSRLGLDGAKAALLHELAALADIGCAICVGASRKFTPKNGSVTFHP